MLDKVMDIGNQLIAACALLAVVYGAVMLIRHNRGKYCRFVFLGMVGIFLGRLFLVILDVAGGDNNVFSLGSLGICCGFLFICTADRKYLSLMNGQSTSSEKRRRMLLSAILPVCEVLMLLIVLIFGQVSWSAFLVSFLLILTAIPCSYFSMREALEPDVPGGFLYCLRPFHIIVCMMTLITVFDELYWLLRSEKAMLVHTIVFYVTCGMVILVIMPALERGMRKWKG